MKDEKVRVLITGGAGFLAQHLVRELQNDYHKVIEEIVIADLKGYKKFLEFEDQIPVVSHQIDCCDGKAMQKLLPGISIVFHLCGKNFSHKLYTNNAEYWKANLESTKCVVEEMKKASVPCLVLASDAFSWMGFMDVVPSPMESVTIRRPKGTFLLGPFAESKFEAECLVREANNNSKGKLLAAIVRPPLLYGEGDSWIVPEALAAAKVRNGVLPMVDLDWDKHEFCYAGNAAAMIAKLGFELKREPKIFGGETFFVTDSSSTSYINFCDFLAPFLKNAGYHFTDAPWEYNFSYGATLAIEKVARFLWEKTGLKLMPDLPNSYTIAVLGMSSVFNSTKARVLMDFLPPYPAPKVMEATINWFNRTHSD